HNDGRGGFNDLYADSVLFYGRSLTKKECINRKVLLLERSQFSQELSSDLRLSVYEGGIFYCAFTKSVSQGGTIKEYPSYLLIGKSGNRYLIEGEGDLITDRNLKFQPSLGIQVPLADLEVIPQTGP